MFLLSQNDSIGLKLLQEIRDVNIQKDRDKFKRNLNKIGMLLGYHLSQSLQYKTIQIETVLGTKVSKALKHKLVAIGVLRAGLPLQEGVLELFTEAEAGFIGSYRKHTNSENFEIKTDYVAIGDINDADVILIDTMLATGSSLIESITSILSYGSPHSLHVVSAIASEKGLSVLIKKYPDVKFWIGDIDEHLNTKFYIVPGLGDAGDLSYGPKL